MTHCIRVTRVSPALIFITHAACAHEAFQVAQVAVPVPLPGGGLLAGLGTQASAAPDGGWRARCVYEQTVKQTHPDKLTMAECASLVIKKDGVIGLFGRGLSTRIITNGLQGLMFNVMWRMGMDYFNSQDRAKNQK